MLVEASETVRQITFSGISLTNKLTNKTACMYPVNLVVVF